MVCMIVFLWVCASSLLIRHVSWVNHPALQSTYLSLDNKSRRYGTQLRRSWLFFFFFLRHVGVQASCICLREVIGACWYLCYLFFSRCVYVRVRWKLRLVYAGRTGAGSFFIPLLCALSGKPLSPAICLPALDIVIPKCRPVNISLVTATSSPTTRQEKTKSGTEMLLVSFCLCSFLPVLSWSFDA